MPLLSGTSTSTSIFVATLAALASYLTADLVVYPRYGNIPALALDIFITLAVLLEMSYVMDLNIKIEAMVIMLALIAAGELYYHRYIQRILFSGRR